MTAQCYCFSDLMSGQDSDNCLKCRRSLILQTLRKCLSWGLLYLDLQALDLQLLVLSGCKPLSFCELHALFFRVEEQKNSKYQLK